MRQIVVIPTFNERANIEHLLPDILLKFSNLDILIVDDNSPDYTADSVRKFMNTGRVHLLLAEKKLGLASAYIRGFKWTLDNKYELIAQMDADFSHQLDDLEKLLSHANSDLVIVGNRWSRFSAFGGWPYRRTCLSWLANFYSRLFLGTSVRDWTSGFNVWPHKVLSSINLEASISKGFCFQIEIKFRALQRGFTVRELGINFAPRRFGESKMSLPILFEALYRIWKIKHL